MSKDQEKQERSRLQHDAEHARPRKRGSVLIYLVVLFAAAFLLLLMSYFMQQRVNEEAIDGLQQTSTSAVQSLENLIKERDALQTQVDELEDAKAELENQVATAKSEAEEAAAAAGRATRATTAMDYLRRIQQFYYSKSYGSARAVIEKFEQSGLADALPAEAIYQNESNSVLSPLEEYQKIYEALY